jgi:hypothetical protein
MYPTLLFYPILLYSLSSPTLAIRVTYSLLSYHVPYPTLPLTYPTTTYAKRTPWVAALLHVRCSLFAVRCTPWVAALLLVGLYALAGHSCWPLAGRLLAACWPLAGV